ncbi:glycosyltransferase family 2 protein [Klenkia terrae]|uniref:Glycosyltransferase n=2 Tax=Klenkia terrae TaxID=1052259 RepID=A0ABU8E6R4_9ACTN
MVHAIIACRNRKELTVRTVVAIAEILDRLCTHGSITVFDDGSTDGTSAAVRTALPSVRIVTGDGDNYWAASMAKAEQLVLESSTTGQRDFILWLNDDVELDPVEARLAILCAQKNDGILVGATVGADGSVTYSGLIPRPRRPLTFSRVTPSGAEQRVATFNGNFVLVPVHDAKKLGGIDGGFSHGLADIDYGLRATREGVRIVLFGTPIGECSRNTVTHQPIRCAWRDARGPKGGLNPANLDRFLARHAERYTQRYWKFALPASWLAKRLAPAFTRR